MNKQAVFDKVYGALVLQGVPSRIYSECRYQWRGYKCAVGHLLSDDTLCMLSKSNNLTTSLRDLLHSDRLGRIPASLIRAIISDLQIETAEDETFIMALQNAHDLILDEEPWVDTFKENMENVRRKYLNKH